MMVIYLLNVLMLSRIGITFDDEGMVNKRLPYYLIVQALGLAALTVNRSWGILLISIVVANLGIILWERNSKSPRIVHLVSLFGLFLIYFLVITLTGEIRFNPLFLSWLIWLIDSVSIIKDLSQLSRINAYSFGFLFIINESNMIIRQVFDWIKINPERSETGEEEGDETPPADVGQPIVGDSPLPDAGQPEIEENPSSDKYLRIDEYKSGRIIGILERVIVYLAMLSNEYDIIGFILAAKAFARFKELDKKVYAEYVLIGTLASILLALIAASLVSGLVR